MDHARAARGAQGSGAPHSGAQALLSRRARRRLRARQVLPAADRALLAAAPGRRRRRREMPEARPGRGGQGRRAGRAAPARHRRARPARRQRRPGLLPSDVSPPDSAGSGAAAVSPRAQARRAAAVRRIDPRLHPLLDHPPALPPSDAPAAQRRGVHGDDPGAGLPLRAAERIAAVSLVEPARPRRARAARLRCPEAARGDAGQPRRYQAGATMNIRLVASGFVLLFSSSSLGQPVEPVHSLAKKEKPAVIETMKNLVSIESGSGDREGLDRISSLVADRLKALGGAVELIEPGADSYRMFDTPEKIGRMVLARFQGAGRKKVLLIAHMDTVYLKGMLAKQPFRIDGERAYGLGISDDKQGIALIIHTVAILKAMNFRDYGTLTVLINGDEEISSPGSRAMLARLGAEHDAVFSCEASRTDSDRLSLATSGIGSVTMTVKGRASHARRAPELGRHALS